MAYEETVFSQEDAEKHRHPVRRAIREGAGSLFWSPPDIGELVAISTPLAHPNGDTVEVMAQPVDGGWLVSSGEEAPMQLLKGANTPTVAVGFCKRVFRKMGVEIRGNDVQTFVDALDELPAAVMRVAQASLQATTLARYHGRGRIPRDEEGRDRPGWS